MMYCLAKQRRRHPSQGGVGFLRLKCKSQETFLKKHGGSLSAIADDLAGRW